MKEFNKSRCIGNIYYLAKAQDKKIGDLERQAGVSAGYLSRINKGDSNSTPSIEFLTAISDLLGVSIDSLCQFDYAGLTPTESYVMKFIEKLIADSYGDALAWEKETVSELGNVDFDHEGANHPLFSVEGDCNHPYHTVYNSYFTEGVQISGACYKLKMEYYTGNPTLYLMCVSADVDERLPFDTDQYELYLVTGWKPTALACSCNALFAPILEKLYAAAKEAYMHPKLASDVMSVINAFMTGASALDTLEDDDGQLPF